MKNLAIISAHRTAHISNEQILSLLIDSASDYSMYMIGVDGRVLSWNSGARKNKGYSSDEIIGEKFHLFFTEDDIKAGTPDKLLDLARTQGRVVEEGWRVRKGGDRFWAKVVISRVCDDGGSLLGFAKITQDLTGQLQQAALRRTADQAIAMNQAKSDFFSTMTMSHELRTPLNAIIGFTELIQHIGTELTEDKKLEYIDIISRSSKKLLNLVDEILDLNNTDSTNLSIKSSNYDVYDHINELFHDNITLFNESDINARLVVDCAEFNVFADRQRVGQIVDNFIHNALKYGKCRGHVSVGARLFEHHAVEIFVDDDGEGVPAECREAVFQQFFRLERDKSTNGNGIGLALCRKLAVLMNGEVGVTDSPLGGARFWLRLPLARQPVADTKRPRPAPASLRMPDRRPGEACARSQSA